MTFNLFGIDFYLLDKLFGFWGVTFKDVEKEIHRSLFALYWNDGNLLIDLFWFHIVDTYPKYWFDQ